MGSPASAVPLSVRRASTLRLALLWTLRSTASMYARWAGTAGDPLAAARK